jgi:hypothetical protein
VVHPHAVVGVHVTCPAGDDALWLLVFDQVSKPVRMQDEVPGCVIVGRSSPQTTMRDVRCCGDVRCGVIANQKLLPRRSISKAGSEVVEYPTSEFWRLLKRDVSKTCSRFGWVLKPLGQKTDEKDVLTSSWGQSTKNSPVDDALWLSGVFSPDTIHFGIIVCVVRGGQDLHGPFIRRVRRH